MSHFTVLVIQTPNYDLDWEDQLEPFDENLELPRYVRYTKEELIAKERLDIESYRASYYERFLKDPKAYKEGCRNSSHINYIENEFPKKLKWTDEEVYNNAILDYEPENIGTGGEVYSTYNPNSKWDWYQMGGRWRGMLRLKKGVTSNYRVGQSGVFGNEPEFKDGVDQARFGDVDFDKMRSVDKFDDAMDFWELFVEQSRKPVSEKEEQIAKGGLYNRDYFLETYKTRENYVKSVVEFSTFAVLKDGEWFEKGEMGWFGEHSASCEETLKWELNFQSLFLTDLHEDSILTIVDCHI